MEPLIKQKPAGTASGLSSGNEETGESRRDKNKGESVEDKERRYAKELADELQTEDYVNYFLKSSNQTHGEYTNRIKHFVRKLDGKISASQLRNVFPAIKTETDPQRLVLLRPQLAYISGKAEKNDKQRKLIFLLDQMINEIKTEAQLKTFQYFFEAIIAYHKYYGENS